MRLVRACGKWSPLNIDDAYRELLTEFDVEVELLRQNISELLGQLVDNGLPRIHSADVIGSGNLVR